MRCDRAFPRPSQPSRIEGHAHAADAIMTTDPFPKSYAVEVTTAHGTFRVGGMCKGSGMIEPRMATMLGYLTTDALVEPATLHRALVDASQSTFNAITVDGESSTNDCVFAMASGDSGVRIDEQNYPSLVEGLRAVALELSLGIVSGGEGATKLIAITVSGAASNDEAWTAARTIANSPLVKTAVHGGDPNWGRSDRRRRPVRRYLFTGERQGPHRIARAIQQRATPRRARPASGRLPAGQDPGHRSQRRRRGQRTRDDVHLRSVGGIRADQRGVSDVVVT